MDSQGRYPLVPLTCGCCHQYVWRLYHHPVHVYLPPVHLPTLSGSLFAANGFARSMFAAGAILYAKPMFEKLGVDGGVSLLGGLTLLCCGGIYGLYFWGAQLRAHSQFAVSPSQG